MEKLKRFFWFINDDISVMHVSDALLAVMSTVNGPDYIKNKDENTIFDKRNTIVKKIYTNMNYKHNNITFNILLNFIQNIYVHGYTVTKDKYIREEREDIMDAIKLIEIYWIKYMKKKNCCELSMDFEYLRLVD